MSLGQAQLVKWSLPAFALILGLLWYKRRRVDRVDPGGILKSKGDTSIANGSSPKASNLCDSGIHTDDSFSLNNSTSTPVEEIISPRKVSESLDIPNRKSSSQSLSLLSNTPWYDDVEDTPEMREIQLGSNPGKSGFEFMAKGSNKSSEFKNNSKNSSIMENVIEEDTTAKVIVANNHGNEQQANASSSPVEFTGVECKHSNEEQQNTSEEQSQKQALSERDSANPSPVSGVLEGSVADEARSEGSTDSGKGGSINNGMYPKDANRVFYEFTVPLKLVGKLIGRGGKFLQQVRNKTDVNIVIKRHPNERDAKLCSMDGLPEGIEAALELIRQHFPEKMYPQLTLEQYICDEIPWVPELIQLTLVENINNDVFISHISKPNHLFIQLPTHPTYPIFKVMDTKITEVYETEESPPVPEKLKKGMIVVAKWIDRWVRVFVENPDPKGEQTLVRLVDHGGYFTFSNDEMRKIRSDFLTVPFQAIEVFLANVQPKEEWCLEAYEVVSQLSNSTVGQAQIVGYVDYNTYINLYFNIHNLGVISLADELIARGLAEPVTLEEVVPQEELLSV